MDDKDPAIERLRPLNMYGYSKHLFDLYARRHGLARPDRGLKYFNVFGPNEDHKGDMRSVVSKAHLQIKRVRPDRASSRAMTRNTRTAARCATSSTSRMPSR